MIDRGHKLVQRRADDHGNIGGEGRRAGIERMVGKSLAVDHRPESQ